MSLVTGSWPRTFQDAFCEKYCCASEDYETEVFWHCLYRHSLPVAWWIFKRDPDFFREDFDLIREVGTMSNPETFRSEVNFFYGRNLRDKNWIRRVFFIRISAKRLIKLKKRIFENPLLVVALLK